MPTVNIEQLLVVADKRQRQAEIDEIFTETFESS